MKELIEMKKIIFNVYFFKQILANESNFNTPHLCKQIIILIFFSLSCTKVRIKHQFFHCHIVIYHYGQILV